MKTYMRKIVAFIRDEEAAAAIEYALLVALIALAVAGGAMLIGPQITRIFGLVATDLTAAS